MATPNDALTFFRRTWETREVDDSTLTVTISWEDENRSQMVYVRVDEKFVHLSSPFARIEQVDPEHALDAAFTYILGIQKTSEGYFVKHVVPLENLDESEVEIGLMMVCSIADNLEKKLLGTDDF